MKAPASKIIRAVDVLRKGGCSTVFNDAISGGRSFKVWGWDQKDYAAAKAALTAQGYTVKQRVTPESNFSWTSGGNTRLWVYG